MAYITKYIYQLLHGIFEEHRDPRVQHLPLVGSPFPVFGVIAAYLAFVLHYGPKWMEKRKAFDLKNVMRVYNAIQVIANFIIFVWGIPNSYLRKEFSLICQPIDPTNTEPWMWKLIYLSYAYYITKYLDLLDTIFFVLRKKNNQITFLHVYHHAGMIFGVYVFVAFLAGSHSTMLGIINLLIHTVMYSYYFVTSVWPAKQSVWWKRYITQLQLLQFGYLVIHFAMAIVFNHCQHPVLISFVGITQNVFMFVLFFDFYYSEYVRKPKLLARNEQQQQRKLQINAKEADQAKTRSAQTDNVQAHILASKDDNSQFDRLQQARATQAAEQLNSYSNTATSRSKLHLLPTSSLLKAKCS
ncbi:PREDICTED: elongation of very long chain fatty acids protein 7 [Rhagoletis zephyria]|uniref:elongation of very long chain fatty acids protein 7 n=2 Tax=Rhagoletis zephyria TaxID=28612 RepID=UPI0008113DE6|nr:PREDICTED: elongation of very long chain fatty acids protein 7 [Rhagoletis zephyria]